MTIAHLRCHASLMDHSALDQLIALSKKCPDCGAMLTPSEGVRCYRDERSEIARLGSRMVSADIRAGNIPAIAAAAGNRIGESLAGKAPEPTHDGRMFRCSSCARDFCEQCA